jgi:hypothetical protein
MDNLPVVIQRGCFVSVQNNVLLDQILKREGVIRFIFVDSTGMLFLYVWLPVGIKTLRLGQC